MGRRPPIPAPRRCTARAERTGERCKNHAVPGTRRCWRHGGAEASARLASTERQLKAVADIVGSPNPPNLAAALHATFRARAWRMVADLKLTPDQERRVSAVVDHYFPDDEESIEPWVLDDGTEADVIEGEVVDNGSVRPTDGLDGEPGQSHAGDADDATAAHSGPHKPGSRRRDSSGRRTVRSSDVIAAATGRLPSTDPFRF